MFREIAILLFTAAAVGALTVSLRQPLILAYIVVGIVAGPIGLGWITSRDPLDLLAQIGVALLLFVVGLKLDLNIVRRLGPVALATGLGQLFFTILFGFLIALVLGMDSMKALYVAIALTFSSTIIIVKLLSDKRELDSLYGRIAVGFLIVQDIAVVIALMIMSALGPGGREGLVGTASEILIKLLVAGILLLAAMRYVLPNLLHVLARSTELMLLFAIAWGTALAALGEYVGFSKEVGAFLAGFSLASSTYREAISTRLSPVRDFLLLFFFLDLGAGLQIQALRGEFLSAVVLSLFVLIGNPMIVVAIMGYMGYRARTSFMAGLTVAQISEFSIVFVAMGVGLGHVGQDALGIVTMVGLLTISACTYMVLNSETLYTKLRPWLRHVQREVPYREQQHEGEEGIAPDVVVFGLGRFGGRLIRHLQERGVTVLGIDFDPEAVRAARDAGLPVLYGDAEDSELPGLLALAHIRWVVSTLPDVSVNRSLISSLRTQGYNGKIAAAAHNEEDAEALVGIGASRVFLPYSDAADHAGETLYRELS